MKTRTIAAVILAVLNLVNTPSVYSQPTQSILAPPEPVQGVFYFDLNGRAEVYQNGILICKPAAGPKIIFSDPLPLNIGDRIVINLSTTDGRFRFAFRSMDGTKQIDFRRPQVRYMEPDSAAIDFTPPEFSKFRTSVKGSDLSKKDFGLPMDPDFLWGGTRKCVLATVITKDMFKTPPQGSTGYNRTEIRPDKK